MGRVHVLVFDDVNLLDVAGPVQVLASASQYAVKLGERDRPSYDIALVSLAGGAVTTSTGVVVDTQKAIVENIDTLVVAGGHGVDAARTDAAIIEYVRQQAALARRACSICNGVFLLAETGLLSGRRAATHWGYCDTLAREFPDISVFTDAAYVEDGKFWSSAGVLAGVDLALALVERDLGVKLANYAARALVASDRRALGESQISVKLKAREAETSRMQALMVWIADHPTNDLSLEALSDRARLSVRSLQRHFHAAAGQAPTVFVEQTRVETARRLMASTDQTLEQIARRAGFGSLSAMQRAFTRHNGVSPAAYRKSLRA